MQYIILENNGVDNKNTDGGAFNNFCAGGQSGIVANVLNECVVTSVGNVISVNTGLLIISGVRVKIIEPVDFSLVGIPAVDINYHIFARATLKTDGVIEFIIDIRKVQPLIQDNLYKEDNGIYEIEIANFIHSFDGSIKNLTRSAKVIYANDIRNIEEQFDNFKIETKQDFAYFKEEVKKSIDQEQVVKNTNKITAVENALIKTGTLSKRNGTMTEQRQQTGGNALVGLEVLDGSYATVNKIQGKTVASKNLINIPSFDCNGSLGYSFYSVDVQGTFTLSFDCKFSSTNGMAPFGLIIDGGHKLVVISTEDTHFSRTYTGHLTAIYTHNDFSGVGKISNIMLNYGSTALPYEPYFAGLKNAQISGIKSIGRNLFDISEVPTVGDIVNNGSSLTLSAYAEAPVYLKNACPDLRVGDVVYLYFNTTGQSTFVEIAGITWHKGSSITITEAMLTISAVGSLRFYGNQDGSSCTISKIQITKAKNSIYMPFTESVMSLPETVELGEWDYIEYSKLYKQTNTRQLTANEIWGDAQSNDYGIYFIHWSSDYKGEGFTNLVNNKFASIHASYGVPSAYIIDGALIVFPNADKNNPTITTKEQWLAYLTEQNANGNPFTIAYKLATQTVTDIIADFEYQVWDKGQEQMMLENTDAIPEITNEYITLLGGDE